MSSNSIQIITLKHAKVTIFFKSNKLRITHVKNLSNWHFYSRIKGLLGKTCLLELNGRHSSVTMSSTDFPSKTWFFGIYLDFQWQKSVKIQYLPHCEPKSYQINSIKSCSSRSFQQH